MLMMIQRTCERCGCWTLAHKLSAETPILEEETRTLLKSRGLTQKLEQVQQAIESGAIPEASSDTTGGFAKSETRFLGAVDDR